MAKTPPPPRCHSCHRRTLRWLDARQRYLCDTCGKVFDLDVVERHNPGLIEPQMRLETRV